MYADNRHGGSTNECQQHMAAAGTAAIANKSGQTQTQMDKHKCKQANANEGGQMREGGECE